VACGHPRPRLRAASLHHGRSGRRNGSPVEPHEEGFGLANPLSVRKQIEGQITWFYNDAMYQECNVTDGRIAENNFDTFLLSRINEEINITFFKTGHWLHGMGHDRGTSVQSGITDAIFQVTGKRYRDLPFRNHDLTWS
jgi:isoquinoline 1-oxidoreductase subunit beta